MIRVGQSVRSLFTKKFIGIMAAVFALVVQPLAVFPITISAAGGNTVYNSIPAVYPGSFPSQGYEATQTSELGDHLHLDGSNRYADSISVGLTSWACGNDFSLSDGVWTKVRQNQEPCRTTLGDYFEHDITLNVYAVNNPTGTPTVGDLITTMTKAGVHIPYRPSYEANTHGCLDPTVDPYGMGTWYDSVTNSCKYGKAFDVTFDLSNEHVVLPDDVIVAVAYNTGDYGQTPLVQNGPYNSLNLSLTVDTDTVTAGTNVESDVAFLRTSGGLNRDSGWEGYTPVVKIDALPVTPETTYVGFASDSMHILGYNTFSTIQAAVNAVSTGGTVSVAAGNYTGDVTINRAMSLVGPNALINPVTSSASRVAEATVTGQVNAYMSGVSVKGFIITNPAWDGVTIKGVHVYGSGSGINGVTVENNIFDSIHNATNKGAYGVMVQGAVFNVTVANNVVNDLVSAGWAHAVEVTPAGGVLMVPQNVTITGNRIQDVSNASGTDQYDFSVDASGLTTANAAQVTFAKNLLSGNVRNLDTAHDLNASQNWWGQSTGPNAGQYSGPVSLTPWCAQAACTSFLSDEQPVSLPVSGNVASTPTAGPTTLTGSSATGDATATLPASTTITASGSGTWDGTLTPPTVTSVNVPAVSGFTTTPGLAIKVGSDTFSLTLSNAARLVLPDQANQLVGFQAPGGSFTEITTVCSADDQATVDAQLVSPLNECKMNVGGDLVVWTKHFTTFATFTRTAVPVTAVPLVQTIPSSVSSFASIFNVGSDNSDTTPAQTSGDVLGTQTTKKVAKTPVVEATASGWKIIGLAWYWWVLILAAVAGLVWYLVARRRNAEN